MIARGKFPAFAAALAGLLFLSACQTGTAPGKGAGASMSATAHLRQIRADAGLPPLVSDSTLERAALKQAGYMAKAGRMQHTTGRGRDFAARMADAGVEAPAAENVAQGRMDMDKLFSMWMNSAGHRRNMLDPRFGKFGLAYVAAGKDGQQRYWALVLGK